MWYPCTRHHLLPHISNPPQGQGLQMGLGSGLGLGLELVVDLVQALVR